MITRILSRLILGKKDKVVKLVKLRGKIYLLKIEQYESATDFINKMGKAPH